MKEKYRNTVSYNAFSIWPISDLQQATGYVRLLDTFLLININ